MLLVARPGSLVVQLDSNPAWQSGQETGADATHLYREIYNRSVTSNYVYTRIYTVLYMRTIVIATSTVLSYALFGIWL